MIIFQGVWSFEFEETQVLYIVIPNKSKDDKNENEKNNRNIVSLSRVINNLNSQDSAISMSYILM